MPASTPDTSPAAPRGLTSAEAEARLAQYGPNLLEQTERRNLFAILRGAFREPMFLFLIAAALLYFLLGDRLEGAFMLAGATVAIALVVFQEARSESALAALKRLGEPNARVVRDGEQALIPARMLVPGDAILIGEGQRAPADIALRGGEALSVDESILTGESAPVTKHAALSAEPDAARLFAGTMIARGQAIGEVESTGAATRLGAIGGSLAQTTRELTPLQKTTGALVARLGLLAIGFCITVVLAYGLVRADWIAGAFAGLTLAIALLPEEFPMVLAVFLAMGAWRLARHNVLVRRAAATEGLGAITMLCVDKTGTLTENRMTVAAIWTGDALYEGAALNSEAARAALQIALLASAEHPVDPMDRAVHIALPKDARAEGANGAALVRGFPLRPELLAVTQVWRMPDGRHLSAAKGAPEAIFSLCQLSPQHAQTLHAQVAELARRGMRVLAAAAQPPAAALIEDPRQTPFEFAGLIAFHDPLRADAPAALREARGAGVQVAMITGDYPDTALEIARQAGIETDAGVLTGQEIAALPQTELLARVRRVRVFARVKPEDKLRLVEAFKAVGHVVAMTGDGVNDAPALKASHIGIAMGKRGADVAREAADLILLDDNFASIVGGIRLGRRIFANLRKALTYIMAIHVPIAGLALAPILLGLPPLLFPLHVVLLELIIDPVCSLAFESERSEARAMRRPPRPAGETLFGRKQMALAVVQGGVLLAAVFALYAGALSSGGDEDLARTQAMIALGAGNLALALSESSAGAALFDRSRLIFWSIVATALVVFTLLLSLPVTAGALRLAPLDLQGLSLALTVGLIGGGWYGVLTRLKALLDGGASARALDPDQAATPPSR